MKKILALLLALVMVMALAACGGGSAPAEEPAAEAPVEEAAAPAAPEAPEAPAEPAAAPEAPADAGDASGEMAAPVEAGDDLAAYKDYLKAIAMAGAPSPEAGESVSAAIDAANSWEEIQAINETEVLFSNEIALEYQAWVEAGQPEADTTGIVSEAEQQAAAAE